MLKNLLVDAIYVVQHFFASKCFGTAGDETGRQFIPLLSKCVVELLHVLLQLQRFGFVRLGEDNGERHLIFTEEVHELKVYLLRLQAGIYQDKKTGQLLTLSDVGGNQVIELLDVTFAWLGVAVGRKVRDIPLCVHEEMIDEHRFARCGRGHC